MHTMFCDLFLSEMQGKLIDFGSWGVELFQINIYIFKVKNRNSSKRCEIVGFEHVNVSWVFIQLWRIDIRILYGNCRS